MKLLKLVPDNTNIAFLKLRVPFFVLSIVLIVGSWIAVGVNGLAFGVDFAGGQEVRMTFTQAQTAPIPSLREKIATLGYGEPVVQEFGAPNQVSIRVKLPDGAEETPDAAKAIGERVIAAVKADYADARVDGNDTVSGKVAGEFRNQAILALLAAMAAVSLYIWVRFEWQFGVGAMFALVHDVSITLGLFALTQWEFSLQIVAAILAIIGYSLNDTIVVYDRIRENLKKFRKMEMGALLDLSVNETLARTVMTSLTLFIALIPLLIFGPPSLFGMVAAITVGLFVGTYSSCAVPPRPEGMGRWQTPQAADGGVSPPPLYPSVTASRCHLPIRWRTGRDSGHQPLPIGRQRGGVGVPAEALGQRRHGLARGWAGEDRVDACRHGLRRAFDQPPGDIAGNQLARAAHVAGHHRRPAGERLDPGIGEALVGGRQHHHIGGRKQQRHQIMVDRASEEHAPLHALALRLRAQGRLVLALADQHQPRLGYGRERLNGDPLPLARNQRADAGEQWRARRHDKAQLLGQLAAQLRVIEGAETVTVEPGIVHRDPVCRHTHRRHLPGEIMAHRQQALGRLRRLHHLRGRKAFLAP